MSEPKNHGNTLALQSVIESPEMRKRIVDALGDGHGAMMFTSSILSAVGDNAKLIECEPRSVVSAALIAASLDLPVNSSLGLAHIVPYDGRAQFQIGWKGIYQLAMRSNAYKTISVSTVYAGEMVGRNRFTGEMFFDESRRTSDDPVGCLLYFRLLNGFEKYFFMTEEELYAHAMRYSKLFKKGLGMWVTNPEVMKHKTVAKLGLGKFGVLSVQMQTAFRADQAVVLESGKMEYVDNPTANATTVASAHVVEIPKSNPPAVTETPDAPVAYVTKTQIDMIASLTSRMDQGEVGRRLAAYGANGIDDLTQENAAIIIGKLKAAASKVFVPLQPPPPPPEPVTIQLEVAATHDAIREVAAAYDAIRAEVFQTLSREQQEMLVAAEMTSGASYADCIASLLHWLPKDQRYEIEVRYAGLIGFAS